MSITKEPIGENDVRDDSKVNENETTGLNSTFSINEIDPNLLLIHMLLGDVDMNIERGYYFIAQNELNEVKIRIDETYQKLGNDKNHNFDINGINQNIINPVVTITGQGMGEYSLTNLLIDCDFYYGILLRHKSKYIEAIKLLSIVQEKREQIFGLRHPKTSIVLGELSLLETLKCNFRKATELIDLAIDINSKFFAIDHPNTLILLIIKAKTECCRGNFKISFDMITETIKKSKLLFPIGHPIIADCFLIAAESTRCLSNPKSAHKYFDEAREIRLKFYPYQQQPHILTCEATVA